MYLFFHDITSFNLHSMIHFIMDFEFDILIKEDNNMNYVWNFFKNPGYVPKLPCRISLYNDYMYS